MIFESLTSNKNILSLYFTLLCSIDAIVITINLLLKVLAYVLNDMSNPNV